MKPYGREKTIKGSGRWKKDYHIHKKGRKVKNWWEEIADFFSRSAMKQETNKRIEEEL